MELTIVIGGAAGQGLNTVDYLLGKTLFRMGYNIFTAQDYMSRIRGGHNFVTIRFGTVPVESVSDEIDILIALNEETISLHKDRVVPGGLILYDGEAETGGKELLQIKAKEIVRDINPRGVNTVFVGAVLKLLSLDCAEGEKVIREYFSREDIQEDNIKLLQAGYNLVDSRIKLEKASRAGDQIYINGNDALAMGAAVAGVKFYVAYPMSPATGIMNYLAGKQKELGLVVEQAEDEIAAINMALGASFSGIRAMTGTSGGGFALMTEAVGLAGIGEIPVVIADAQRPGPATGLPTRTEQGDLLFAINAGQGDLPLVVLAPRNHEDLFRQAFRAFDLADKYRIPVIILTDQYLADSTCNVPAFDFSSLKVEYYLMEEGEIREYANNEEKVFKPYLLTEDGISPRAYPGLIPGQVVLMDSDEHDEYGHITEDGEVRKAMVEKRARKLDKLCGEDLEEPLYLGGEEIDYLLIGWGSTYGALKEAREILEEEGFKVGLLSYSDVWPLPVKRLNDFRDKELVIVENNATAQFGRLISSETGIRAKYNILKYDGRPFTAREIVERFKEEVIK